MNLRVNPELGDLAKIYMACIVPPAERPTYTTLDQSLLTKLPIVVIPLESVISQDLNLAFLPLRSR